MFLVLPKHWEKFAIQLEDAFAKLTEIEAVESSVRELSNTTTLGKRVPLFVFTLNGRGMRVKKLRRPLMEQRRNFIKRC